jgi:hypothetical protein
MNLILDQTVLFSGDDAKGQLIRHDPNRTSAVPIEQYYRNDWRVSGILLPLG